MPNRKCVALLLFVCSVIQDATAATFGIGLNASPSLTTVGGTIVYTVLVTNIETFPLTGVTVTDTLPNSVTLVNATTSLGNITTSNNTMVAVSVGTLGFFETVTNIITVTANTAGTKTNSVTAFATGFPSEGTNITTTVTNAARGLLRGVIKVDPGQVFVDDRLRFSIIFTNTGNAAAENIVVSNLFSHNVLLRSVTPNNLVSPFTGNNLLLNAGSLGPGESTSFNVVVQPTNSGPLVITSAFAGSNLSGTNDTSGSVSNFVFTPDTNQLTAVTASYQTFDRQTGLMKQTIHVSNIGTSVVSSARVIVAGLSNRLYNAVGTNGNNPFIVYSGTLAPGEGVDLILEYAIPSRTPGPDPQLTAYPIAAINLNAPESSPPNISRIVQLDSGAILIEFPAEPGHSYTILYSDSSSFTNALRAQPSIVAPANRVQWIDEGPPKTISRPADASSRFYRVVAE